MREQDSLRSTKSDVIPAKAGMTSGVNPALQDCMSARCYREVDSTLGIDKEQLGSAFEDVVRASRMRQQDSRSTQSDVIPARRSSTMKLVKRESILIGNDTSKWIPAFAGMTSGVSAAFWSAGASHLPSVAGRE